MSFQKINSLFPNSLVSINGEIKTPKDANISIFDRGFLFGDSVYEVTSITENCPMFFDEHYERLINSAALIGLELRFPKKEILNQIYQLYEKTKYSQSYVRIIVTRGIGEISLDYNNCHDHSLIIIIKELPENPKTWYQNGVHMMISSILRNDKRSMDPNAKSGNYLNNILALNEAKKAGAYDAIMVNNDGFVTEGSTNNIWMIKDEKFITPSLECGLLKGITRTKIIKLLNEHNLPIHEAKISPTEILSSDEAFLTSATKSVIPITQINDTIIGDGNPGKWTKHISEIYQKFIEKHRSSFSFDNII